MMSNFIALHMLDVEQKKCYIDDAIMMLQAAHEKGIPVIIIAMAVARRYVLGN